YPPEEYWRPILAFILLFAAAAPVMFIMFLPKKLLVFTAIYPFLAFWLIWGGTILAPMVALVGFVVAGVFFQIFGRSNFALGFFGAIVIALIVWTLGSFVIPEGASDNALLPAVPSRDLGGFMLNMMLGLTCVSLSLPLGIALALGRQSDMPLIKGICVVFIEFVRGVPLITLLFVASVMLSYFFPPDATVDLFLRVVIMITLFSAAYIAEVVRGGLAALPKGQYEAADSLGLDYPQAMRLIILPQALKISIPGIVNVAVGLFKDTTLVSVISMFDLVGMIRGPILASTEWNGVYWELLGFAAALFFVVCYGISQYSQWLERKLHKGH
ncbi:MAG: amino acid ABC transporter permease, partial [Pseudomonadota bacterium]|nr:amino acid ABC transporter permease [Pseudomonadota bacterium]